MADQLTSTLTDSQIKENITALQKQGVGNDKIQAYVNNYSKIPTGNYVLKTASPAVNKFGLDTSSHPLNPLNHNNELGAPTPSTNVGKNFMGALGGNIKDAFNSGVQQVKQGFSDAKAAGANPIKQTEAALKTGAGVVNTVSSPLAPLFKPVGDVINAVGDKIGSNPTVQKFADSKAGKATSRVAEDVSNAATLFQGVAAAKSFSDTYAANQAAKAKPQLNDLVGKITQETTPADIAKSKSALSSLDTSGVKDFKDLASAANAKIKSIADNLNPVLANTEPVTLDQLEATIKVGDKTIYHNYVTEAIDQLKNFYDKTNNVKGQTQLAQFEAKANSEGLNIMDINDLAKLHGQELNAYNANGELASGLSKQAAENTRMGLKTTARQSFNDPVYNAADEAQSNLIKLRDTAGDLDQKVQALQNKIKAKGLGAKAGAIIAKVTDTLSGGALKGAVNYFIPRGEGLKVLNALDLEKGLSSNLKLLDKINGMVDTTPAPQLLEKLQVLLKSNPNK